MGISDQLGHQRSCVGGSHFLMGVVQTFAWKITLNTSIQHSRDNIVHIALKSSSDETLCKSSANTLPSVRSLDEASASAGPGATANKNML